MALKTARPPGPHGAVRPPRPGRRRQPAPRLPAHLRRHRRRPVDRREPLDVLRPPRLDRGDDPRPRRRPRSSCWTRSARAPIRPRAAPSASRSWTHFRSAGAMVRGHHPPRPDEGLRPVDARRRLRVLRLRPRDLRAHLPSAPSGCPDAASPWRWPSGWGFPRRSWPTRARGSSDKEAQAEALLKRLEEDRARPRRRTASARRGAPGARRGAGAAARGRARDRAHASAPRSRRSPGAAAPGRGGRAQGGRRDPRGGAAHRDLPAIRGLDEARGRGPRR